MRPSILVTLLVVSLAPSLGASPQEVIHDPSSPAAGEDLLTEEEFLRAVDENHPALRALLETGDHARAEVIEARAFQPPTLEVVREAPDADAEELEFTVAWQLPRPARRQLLIAAAEHRVDAAQHTLTAGRLRVRSTLRHLFAAWAAAEARARRLSESVDYLSELAERERRRTERGESSGLDARRLELAAAEVRARLAVAEAERLRARGEAIGFVSGLPKETTPVLPPLPEGIPEENSPPPELAALTAKREAARLAREAADLLVDWPQFMAGWKSEETPTGTSGGPILGISWPLPVAARGRAARGRTQARLDAAEARLTLAADRLQAEQSAARAAYHHLAMAAHNAREATAGNASLLEASAAAFRYGELGLTDLLETLRSVLGSELTALDLHTSALAAHRDLEQAVGRASESPVIP